MEVRWFEEPESAVPCHDRWLSPNECETQEAFRIAKRRCDWRLGRWTAKRAVASSLDNPPPLAEIEIRATASGAPEAICSGAPLRCSISITHSNGVACCAIAPGIFPLGCDLESMETRSSAFLSTYFTSEEERQFTGLPREEQSSVATLLWSAKESALKALHVGLRADTRSVSVRGGAIGVPGWQPFTARHSDGVLYGYWSMNGRFVRTVASSRRFVVR